MIEEEEIDKIKEIDKREEEEMIEEEEIEEIITTIKEEIKKKENRKDLMLVIRKMISPHWVEILYRYINIIPLIIIRLL